MYDYFLRYKEREVSVIKQFIRNFLILMLLCVLPVFVYADETASIKITTNLTTGTPNGIFKFTIKEVGTDTYIPDANGIEINTAESNFYTINNLKPNTEYLIEELTLPTAYDFVSLESGNKMTGTYCIAQKMISNIL